MSGKKIRLNRFFYAGTQTGLIVPLDHGLTLGPVAGVDNLENVSSWIASSSLTGVILHKGLLERLSEFLGTSGVMLHLNGMSTLAKRPDTKERLTSMETALRLGADGVSVQVNFDGDNDAENLQLLGQVVDEASEFGLPVMTMLYDKVKGNAIPRLRHLMRIAVELGTDALKLAAPENLEMLPEMVDGFTSHTRIFVAGGSLCSDDQMFRLAEATVLAGASGLCVGRNVFQRENPAQMLSQLESCLLQGRLLLQPARVSHANH